MWQVLVFAIIVLAVSLGFSAPEWVPWALTGLLACGILLVCTVKAVSRGLFGRLDGEGETPNRELTFHWIVMLVVFFASMWLSWILR